jgi:hypothetical protein
VMITGLVEIISAPDKAAVNDGNCAPPHRRPPGA